MLPLSHEILILPEFATIFGALSLLDSSNQRLFVVTLSMGRVVKILLSHFKLNQVSILHLLVIRPDVLSTFRPGFNRAGQVVRILHGLLHLPLNSAGLEPSHRLGLKLVRRRAFPLHDRQFDLVEQAQGRTPLLLHDCMGHLAIEAHFQRSKGVFYQVEIVHLCLLGRPDNLSNG